jgi:hypothetical protein
LPAMPMTFQRFHSMPKRFPSIKKRDRSHSIGNGDLACIPAR